MLVRFNQPNSFDRILESFFRGGRQDDGNSGISYWTPAVDITEMENEYIVKAELPGVNKEDVKITLESNILTIRGEKKQEENIKGDNYHRTERLYGTFQRSFKLPETLKSDKIDATFKDGILIVSLPKAEEAKPKQIEIRVK